MHGKNIRLALSRCTGSLRGSNPGCGREVGRVNLAGVIVRIVQLPRGSLVHTGIHLRPILCVKLRVSCGLFLGTLPRFHHLGPCGLRTKPKRFGRLLPPLYFGLFTVDVRLSLSEEFLCTCLCFSVRYSLSLSLLGKLKRSMSFLQLFTRCIFQHACGFQFYLLLFLGKACALLGAVFPARGRKIAVFGTG